MIIWVKVTELENENVSSELILSSTHCEMYATRVCVEWRHKHDSFSFARLGCLECVY